MKFEKQKTFFNKKKLQQVLQKGYQFITDLEKHCNFPKENDTAQLESTEEMELGVNQTRKQKPGLNVKQRLRTLEEIQSKLEEVKGKRLNTYGERMYKKNLKTRLTKQQKKEKRKLEKKKDKSGHKKHMINATVALENDSEKKAKQNENDNQVVFNKGSKMVFSKIDFSGVGEEKFNRKRKRENDPKFILEGLQKTKVKLNELEQSGETDKAKKIKEKQMWMSALKRSEGVKVKDDEALLKRTIKKQKQAKNRCKKKWDVRVEATKKQMEDRQKKRAGNIAAKKKERKDNKFKKAVKKGRIFL